MLPNLYARLNKQKLKKKKKKIVGIPLFIIIILFHTQKISGTILYRISQV